MTINESDMVREFFDALPSMVFVVAKDVRTVSVTANNQICLNLSI